MENKEHLQELMTNIVDTFGKKIIMEKRFVNLLADYRAFDGNNDARRILNAIVAGRYAGLIVNLSSSQLDLPYLKYYAQELSKSEGFKEDTIESIMRMMVFACNKVSKSDADYTIVQKEEKYGCVDSSGKIIIPFEYDKIFEFKSDFGIHLVCLERFVKGEVYTTSGELVFSGGTTFNITNERDLWIVEQNNKYGLIHPNGEIVVPFIYRSISNVHPCKDIKLLVVETDTGYGMLDYKGTQILPPVFESICNRMDDVFDFIEAQLRNRYMYFNQDGTVADISPLFCTTPLTEESYNANDHKKPKGYIVNRNQLVVSTTHQDITDLTGKIICNLGKFNDGLAVAQDNPWIGYMDTSLTFKIREFRTLQDCKFDLCEPFNNGLAIVWKGAKKGVINTEGKIIASTHYTNIIRREWCLILRYAENTVRTIFNDEYFAGDCYIMPYSKDDKFVCIVNGIYDIGNFSNNKTFAQYRNFVGIVTSDGKSIEPLEYEWHRSWNSRRLHETRVLSPVRRNGKWGGLDIEHGFIPFKDEMRERNEKNYISKHIETSTPIPYFMEYQKDVTPCGFKWSNLYHIPAGLYADFMKLRTTMAKEEQLQWLKTNSVIVLE